MWWAAMPRPSLLPSLASPAYLFVILTHPHNTVPLAFLWDGRARCRGDRDGTSAASR